MFNPRKPTAEEREALSGYLHFLAMTNAQEDTESIDGCIDTAAIAVFDEYVSNSPGYRGKVMFVVWSAGPSCYEVFTFGEQGELYREYQDAAVS